MSKRFETKFDTDREESAIGALLSGSDWLPEKLGPHDVDFLIRDADGAVRRCRSLHGSFMPWAWQKKLHGSELHSAS